MKKHAQTNQNPTSPTHFCNEQRAPLKTSPLITIKNAVLAKQSHGARSAIRPPNGTPNMPPKNAKQGSDSHNDWYINGSMSVAGPGVETRDDKLRSLLGIGRDGGFGSVPFWFSCVASSLAFGRGADS